MPTSEKTFVFLLRMLMAWTFLYAASHQGIFAPEWSVAGFLNHTKTFHDLFAVFGTPSVAPIVTFLVSWGHLLIGLSLLVGLMVRVSASFGIMLMLFYWMAHMDFPFIENKNNFIVDYHIVYATILGYLIYKQAGHFGVSMGSLQEFPPSGMAKPCTLSSLNRRSSGRLHA